MRWFCVTDIIHSIICFCPIISAIYLSLHLNCLFGCRCLYLQDLIRFIFTLQLYGVWTVFKTSPLTTDFVSSIMFHVLCGVKSNLWQPWTPDIYIYSTIPHFFPLNELVQPKLLLPGICFLCFALELWIVISLNNLISHLALNLTYVKLTFCQIIPSNNFCN